MIFKNIKISEEDKKRICNNDIVFMTFTRLLIELRDPMFFPKHEIFVKYNNYGTTDETLYILPMIKNKPEEWNLIDNFCDYMFDSEIYGIASSIGAFIDAYITGDEDENIS